MPVMQSKRAALSSQSDIRHMTIECARLGGVNLAQGVCDLDVPEPVLAGADQAARNGCNTYTRFDGLPELRKAIAGKVNRFTGLDVPEEGSIVSSAGATGAFSSACMGLLDPGDEVLLFEPYYGYHVTTLRSLGMEPVFVPLELPDWSFTNEALERAVTNRTRALVLNTPNNPCGKVFSRAELQRIASFAETHDLWVFTDEIYEHFLYDGLEHIAPATLPALAPRTVTISGLSKVFAITGWRIGYAICPPDAWTSVGHCNDLLYVCAPAPLQMGAARGLNELGADYYRDISDDHQKKRDRFCSVLADIGLAPHIPQGAYYVLADVSRLPGADSRERALHLLEKTGVACVPGRAFYHEGGHDLARFCFAKKWHVLEDACSRLERLG